MKYCVVFCTTFAPPGGFITYLHVAYADTSMRIPGGARRGGELNPDLDPVLLENLTSLGQFNVVMGLIAGKGSGRVMFGIFTLLLGFFWFL